VVSGTSFRTSEFFATVYSPCYNWKPDAIFVHNPGHVTVPPTALETKDYFVPGFSSQTELGHPRKRYSDDDRLPTRHLNTSLGLIDISSSVSLYELVSGTSSRTSEFFAAVCSPCYKSDWKPEAIFVIPGTYRQSTLI
jgi:hypothetical protein